MLKQTDLKLLENFLSSQLPMEWLIQPSLLVTRENQTPFELIRIKGADLMGVRHLICLVQVKSESIVLYFNRTASAAESTVTDAIDKAMADGKIAHRKITITYEHP